jgi:hypothetical protein
MPKLSLKRRWKKVALITAALALCLVFAGYIYDRYFRYNNYASCANCRKSMWYVAAEYAREHDDWLPRDGKTPVESISAAIQDDTNVSHFASHAMQSSLVEYWRENKKLDPELVIYEYVQGLKLKDPSNLVLFHTKKSSKWECREHKVRTPGRAVGFLDNHWRFLPEEEFQRELQRTNDYLVEHGRVPSKGNP